jgi:phosphoglucosamine mutase
MVVDIPKLFGTSGIRGKINETITPQLALEVGMALATYAGDGGGKIVLGYDTRTSSPMLAKSLISGILNCGCDVLNLKMVPTPVVGYATKKMNAVAGVMVTASHNPSEYNGFKLWGPDGMAYRQDQERTIEEIIFNKTFQKVPWSGIGKIKDISAFKNIYANDLISISHVKPGLKVVVDGACGAGAELSPLILRKTGCEVLTMNCQPDGFFPGRNPEPSKDNLNELMKVVKATGADLGIAHDGDADRMVAVDDMGRMAEFDKLLALVCAKIGKLAITTVDASGCVDRCMNEVGGQVKRTKVGDVHVAEKIKKEDAAFGGEPSGTWIHPDFCMCPDGILSALRVIELVQEKGALSKLLDDLETYPTHRIKVNCREEQKNDIMKSIANEIAGIFDDVKDVNTIDGVRITLQDESWVLIRPSGTESFIRITLEGMTTERADEILGKSENLLINTIMTREDQI